jgi:glycosyltransferase involved in cell wall biosynthesis
MNNLIFFTSEYPYGKGETFIENEIPFLAAAFERIIIVTNQTTGHTQRAVPEKVKIVRVSDKVPLWYKMKAAFEFFSPIIKEEMSFIRQKNIPLSRPVFSAMLGGYAQALYIQNLIETIVTENNLPVASTVLYSYWMSNVAAGTGLYKLKHPEVRAVCRAHGWDVYFERHQPAYLPLRRFILSAVDYCCCISENGAAYLKNLVAGRTKNNIVVSRLGTFNKTGKISHGHAGKLVLVSCSNIIPLKRIHLLIDSLALIDDIPVQWTHFGSGALEGEMKTLAHQKLSSKPNINFHFAGQVSNARLLDYYADNNIDLFINLSETEGLPVSFMEAGSFAIPVIATNVGGVSEIIKDGTNGFLLAADALPQQVAEKITAYYKLPAPEKEAIRNNALKNWHEKFSAPVNYPQFMDFLK